MKAFFKKRRELIFFGASVALLLVVILYAFSAIRFLVVEISAAVDPHDVRVDQAPIEFEIERFEALGLDPSQSGE